MATFPSPQPARGRPLTLALLLTAALVLGPAPVAAAADDGRTIVRHRVVPGDTPSGLAVRYHAWTREVIALNGSVLRVGEVIRIPVVDRAAAEAKPKKKTSTKPRATARDRKMWAAGWRHWKLPRGQVKRLIIREARQQGVPVGLALAVGWQESGWHQPVVSVDDAIGVMQLLPTSGEWMEMYLGREINLRNTRHNVKAGVRMLRVLLDNTSTERRAVAAYYQGLSGLRRQGMYAETRQYVANVMAIRKRVRHLP